MIVATLLVCGCALDPAVDIYPILLSERSSRPFDDVVSLVEAGDYGRALASRRFLLEKESLSVIQLMALGEAEVMGGWLAEAREHLGEAYERAQDRETKGLAAWYLSQSFYLEDRFSDALDWVERAESMGLEVSRGHRSFLEVLARIPSRTRVEGASSGPISMEFGEPSIPRIRVGINDLEEEVAVVDTGAVYTIVSKRLAEASGVERMGRSGTLLGLLGETISIEYGIVRKLEIGGVVIFDLPVAIASDESLHFFTVGERKFQMNLLLGANLLRRFRHDFNFAGRTLEMVPVEKDSKPASDQNLFLVGFRPMVQTSVNRRGWYMFLVDTGSEVTFLNADKIEATTVRGRAQIHGATLQGLGGSRKRGSQLLGVEVVLAGWGGMFATLPLYGQGHSESYGIVGENFLSEFRVIMDFGKMRIDLLRDGQSAEALRGVTIRTN